MTLPKAPCGCAEEAARKCTAGSTFGTGSDEHDAFLARHQSPTSVINAGSSSSRASGRLWRATTNLGGLSASISSMIAIHCILGCCTRAASPPSTDSSCRSGAAILGLFAPNRAGKSTRFVVEVGTTLFHPGAFVGLSPHARGDAAPDRTAVVPCRGAEQDCRRAGNRHRWPGPTRWCSGRVRAEALAPGSVR